MPSCRAGPTIGLIPLLNLVVAFVVAGLVVLLVGENPLDALPSSWSTAPSATAQGIGFTLFYATNFIFTGLAVAVAFHAGLFNIGGEGQAYIGGLGVALVCLALRQRPALVADLPAGDRRRGARSARPGRCIPAYLQAKRGSHIVITTIMFNFIAAALMVYLLVDVLKPPGAMAPQTRTFARGRAAAASSTGCCELFGVDARLGAAQRLLPAGARHGLSASGC